MPSGVGRLPKSRQRFKARECRKRSATSHPCGNVIPTLLQRNASAWLCSWEATADQTNRLAALPNTCANTREHTHTHTHTHTSVARDSLTWAAPRSQQHSAKQTNVSNSKHINRNAWCLSQCLLHRSEETFVIGYPRYHFSQFQKQITNRKLPPHAPQPYHEDIRADKRDATTLVAILAFVVRVCAGTAERRLTLQSAAGTTFAALTLREN